MRYQSYPQVKVVTASTGEEFEQKLNAALADLATKGSKHELTFNLNAGHCAYIRYEERVAIPETVEDEFRVRGEIHYCVECPHYVPSMDGRTKYSRCDFIGTRVTGTTSGCEWLYKRLAEGSVKLVER